MEILLSVGGGRGEGGVLLVFCLTSYVIYRGGGIQIGDEMLRGGGGIKNRLKKATSFKDAPLAMQLTIPFFPIQPGTYQGRYREA